MRKNAYFVSGIGTEVGKTVSTAILRKALNADYWKPIQSGDLDYTDSMKVEKWSACSAQVFPERHRLQTPASPHWAAQKEGIRIGLEDFEIPQTDNTLLIEGAGGLLVPLNEKDTLFDLIKKWQIPLILVSRHYLGSINHTLLSLEAIRQAQIPLRAIIFNGDPVPSTEQAITSRLPANCQILRLPNVDLDNEQEISNIAQNWSKAFNEF